MDEIEVFNILNKSPSKNIKIFILLLIAMFLLIIPICFYPYSKYIKTKAVVKYLDSDYKVILYLKDISKINQYEFYIENIKKDFSVLSISEDYYLIEGDNFYEVILSLDLDDFYKLNNNVLELKIKLGKTTIIERIKEVIL